MTRPCFALTVLAALLGISLSLAGQAQCQTLTDLYRCGSDYSEICPFVDGAPNVEDEVPPNTEEMDLRGMSVVAFLEDPSHDEMSDVAAEETDDYDNYYEEAYRKYYDEAYGVSDTTEAQAVVADPEPETMTEAMQAYCSGYDAVYDVTVYGLQQKQDSEDTQECLGEATQPLCHEPSSMYEEDEYCADEYDDEYYDQYYGGDYRYYDEGQDSRPIASEETTVATEEEEACYGYENYGPKYEYYYSSDSTPSVPEADEVANEEVVEPENWDSEGYDYDEYYDYRDDYEEQYAQESTEDESEQAADNWDEDRHGYYDYAYPYGYDGYDGDGETDDDSYETEEVAADDAEVCEWDRNEDGFYDEMSEPTPYEYDEYGAEAAERYEEECSEEQPVEVQPSTEDEAYWDDSYYGYDYSLGEECTDDLDSICDPVAESQGNSTDVEPYEDDCNEYDDVYDDYYYDDCGCPETHAVAQVGDVAQLGRDMLESAMQSELATVMRGQADKLFVKAGSLISDANMEELWQRLHQAAESEANAVALHQPNVFVFYFEVDQVTKAELAGRGALVWAAQVLDRVGSACQQASEQLEQIATVELRDTWMAQEDGVTQR